jgi:hypothetical protein
MGASSDPVYARPDQQRRCAQGVGKQGRALPLTWVSLFARSRALVRPASMEPARRRRRVAALAFAYSCSAVPGRLTVRRRLRVSREARARRRGPTSGRHRGGEACRGWLRSGQLPLDSTTPLARRRSFCTTPRSLPPTRSSPHRLSTCARPTTSTSLEALSPRRLRRRYARGRYRDDSVHRRWLRRLPGSGIREPFDW